MPLNRNPQSKAPAPTLPSVEEQRAGVRNRNPQQYGLISGALPTPVLGGPGGGVSMPPTGGFIPPVGGTTPLPPGPGNPGRQPRGGVEPVLGGDPPRPPGRGNAGPTGVSTMPAPEVSPISLPDAFKGRVAREKGAAPGMTTNLMPTPTSTLDTGGFGGQYTPTKAVGKKKGGLGSFGMY